MMHNIGRSVAGDPSVPEFKEQQASWRRLAGMGFELFGSVLGFTVLGLLIDQRFDTAPKGVLIGSILGVIGGLYNLIRTSLRTLNPSPKAREPGNDHER